MYNSTRPIVAFKFTLFDRDTGQPVSVKSAGGGLAKSAGLTMNTGDSGRVVGFGNRASARHPWSAILPATNAGGVLTYIVPRPSKTIQARDDDDAGMHGSERTVTLCLRAMSFTDAQMGNNVHVAGVPYKLPCFQRALRHAAEDADAAAPRYQLGRNAEALCCV